MSCPGFTPPGYAPCTRERAHDGPCAHPYAEGVLGRAARLATHDFYGADGVEESRDGEWATEVGAAHLRLIQLVRDYLHAQQAEGQLRTMMDGQHKQGAREKTRVAAAALRKVVYP